MGRYTIEDARNLAMAKGGKFLSQMYGRANAKYEWECESKHRWTTSLVVVRMGCWCPVCAIEKTKGAPRNDLLRYTIEDVRKIALERGGRLLSTEYRSVRDKMDFMCKEGHTWTAEFASINKGSWCPSCCGHSTERLVRRMFEFIFKEPFLKARPAWLISPLSNQRLELDGYNESLKIAFEYDGLFHYEQTEFIQSDLAKVQARDLAKSAQCAEKGILLVRIPYTVKQPDMYAYILSHLPSIPPNTPQSVPMSTFEVVGKSEEKLNDIRAWLKTKFPGAELLSKAYTSSRAKLDFRCAAGHLLHQSWAELCKGNNICKKCGMLNKIQTKHQETIARINRYLASHGYVALDETTYNGSHNKMTVTCRHCQTDRKVTWANLQNYDKRMCCSA